MKTVLSHLKPNCQTSDKRELVSHTLMEATFNKLINEKEFVLLYDCHKSTNPEFPYWNYDRFDLDQTTIARPSFVSTGRTFISLFIHTVSCFDRLSVGSVRHGTVGRFLYENSQIKLKSNVKDMPLMRYLNYLAKIPEVSRENFEN